jgi:hypothetical protein
MGENHEKVLCFGLHQLLNRFSTFAHSSRPGSAVDRGKAVAFFLR